MNPLSLIALAGGRRVYRTLAEYCPQKRVIIGRVLIGDRYLRRNGAVYERVSATRHKRNKYLWELREPADEALDRDEVVIYGAAAKK